MSMRPALVAISNAMRSIRMSRVDVFVGERQVDTTSPDYSDNDTKRAGTSSIKQNKCQLDYSINC